MITLCILQNNGSEEMQKRIQTSLAKISSSFPDPSKAEECFHKLNIGKDYRIFSTLAQLLDEVNLKSAESMRVSYWIQTLSKNSVFLHSACDCSSWGIVGQFTYFRYMIPSNLFSYCVIEGCVILVIVWGIGEQDCWLFDVYLSPSVMLYWLEII